MDKLMTKTIKVSEARQRSIARSLNLGRASDTLRLPPCMTLIAFL
jgi:hypothetical protein